jgi:hypothetical protein
MLTAIRQWVIRTMMKSKGETGIVKTIPKRDLVELNTQVTAQRLMENGIDPNSLKNADQVENAVIAIENRPKIQEGIRSTKSAKVFDMEGKEIPPGSRIMGGKELTDSPLNDLKSIVDDFKPIGKEYDPKGRAQFEKDIEEAGGMEAFLNKNPIGDDLPPPGSRGSKDDIAAPFASQEETMSNMIKDELMKTDNAFSDLVKTTKKGPKTLKEREAEVLAGMEKNNKEAVQRIKNRKMVKDAIDNMSPTFVKGDRKYNAQMVAEDLAEKKFGKEFYDLDQRQQMDLYDEALEGLSEQTRGMPDPEDFAQGGRAGFKTGLGKRFLELLKNKKMFRSKDDVPTSVFSEKTGPITIEDMANIPEDQLRKIRRTQELGLYTETPEILKAGNLFERFTKKVGGKRVIDYDRAEFILNRKLKGNETLNDLLQIEYQTRPGRAEGGRIGLKTGMTKRAFLKLMGGTGAAIGAAKSGIFSGLGKGAGKQVAEEVVKKSVSTPPPYFFELANKIKTLGKPDKVTYADRVEIHRYRGKNGDEYELIEDLNTGDVRITKDKTGVGSYGDKTFDTIEDRTVLEYKKGDADVDPESGTAFKSADEYEEYKVEFDADGTPADATELDAVVQKEILEEASGEAPSIKKAGGGIARMLGE